MLNVSPQVYAASNVELITRTRTDHLTDQNKNKTKGDPICFMGYTVELLNPASVPPSLC